MKISSSDEMLRFAARYASGLKGGEVIGLSGELGAGKTVFAKGLAAGLGITDTIASPTFTIMEEHGGGRLNLYHYDAYRLSGMDEAYEAGVTEYFGRPDGVCVVEWFENLGPAFVPYMTDEIRIDVTGENEREITKGAKV